MFCGSMPLKTNCTIFENMRLRRSQKKGKIKKRNPDRCQMPYFNLLLKYKPIFSTKYRFSVMNLKEDIKSISFVKANASELIKQINETHRPVIVTQNGEAKAVLIDSESYNKMQDTINLLKIISQGENDLRNNRIKENDKFFIELKNKYKN